MSAISPTDSPDAYALGEFMSDISEEQYAAGWLVNTEWILWRALMDWRQTSRAFWSPGGGQFPGEITGHMSELDKLHRAADGWVWWLDGMQFVPIRRWHMLVARRSLAVFQDSNAELARQAPRG